MRKTALAILLALVGVALMSTAQSQQYPPGTIRIIAPGPPGSPRDIRARWVAEQLTSALSQPVIVDNRAGAGGNIGMEAAAKSPGWAHPGDRGHGHAHDEPPPLRSHGIRRALGLRTGGEAGDAP